MNSDRPEDLNRRENENCPVALSLVAVVCRSTLIDIEQAAIGANRDDARKVERARYRCFSVVGSEVGGECARGLFEIGARKRQINFAGCPAGQAARPHRQTQSVDQRHPPDKSCGDMRRATSGNRYARIAVGACL